MVVCSLTLIQLVSRWKQNSSSHHVGVYIQMLSWIKMSIRKRLTLTDIATRLMKL